MFTTLPKLSAEQLSQEQANLETLREHREDAIAALDRITAVTGADEADLIRLVTGGAPGLSDAQIVKQFRALPEILEGSEE